MSKWQNHKGVKSHTFYIKCDKLYTEEFDRILGEGKHRVHVVKTLPFVKRVEAIRMISNLVFTNEGNHIEDYAPEYAELSKRIGIISCYTDFTLPKGLNDTWFILFYTNLYDNAVKIIGEDAKRICDEADKLIESKRKHLENKTELNVLLEKLSDKISSFGGQFSKDDISSIMKVIETLPNYTSENIIGAIAKEYEKIENKE